MKFLSYAGLAIVVILSYRNPQLQYRANKSTYFMEVEDCQAQEIRAQGRRWLVPEARVALNPA